MQEMQFASFASPEWKGVVGTLPGIETQGSYSAATRYSTSSSLSVNGSIDNLYTRAAIHSFEASCARYLGTEL